MFAQAVTFGFWRVTDQNAGTFGTEQAGTAIEGGVLQFESGQGGMAVRADDADHGSLQ